MKPNEIMCMFEKKRNKVDILWDALDHMRRSNVRTPIECVGLAMGLSQEEAYDEVNND